METTSSKPASPWWVTAARWIVLLVAIGGLIACIPLPLVWTDQVLLGALLVGISILLGRFSQGRAVTLTLTMVSLFCTFRYAYWRWASSLRYLNNNGWQVDHWGLVFAFMLLGAETYAVVVLVLGFFQSARPLMRKPVPLPDSVDAWPVVDVFIPTYNEPLEVVRPTVLAAMGIDWPADKLRVYILDDGRRPNFRAFAEECGAEYITRYENAHAKAGNINNALAKTSGEYVAIFDCDHIATRSFLQMTMGWFLKDQRLAMVQTPHHFYSPDPFERNLNVFRKVPNEGSLFYGIVQEGSDLWNASFFCGSCAVIRRKALEEIGGIAVETVTEDAHTSLRMQRRGWNTSFIGIPQAAGLATGSLAAHIGQRIRWARGMVQILRTECPLLASGLKFSQRLCYFNSVIHYLYAIPRLIFLTAPLVYLILGKSNLYGSLWEILAYALPHLMLATMTNSRVQGRNRHSYWNEVYEAVLAPYIALPTTLALINPKWGKFNVTSKGSVVEERFFDFKVARPYLFLIALNLIGIAMAVPRLLAHGDPSGVLVVNVVWASLNTLLLGTTIAVSIESRQQRSNVRIAANMPVRLSLPSGNAYDGRLVDISEGGLAVRSERPVDLRPGTHAEVIVRSMDGDEHFPVEMVGSTKNTLRLKFTSADLEQQRALTRIVYSRADSWLNWTDGQSEDHVLGSLFQILGIGLRGLFAIPGALIQTARRRSKESKLAAVGQTVAPVILFFVLLFSSSAAKAAAPQGASTLAFHDKQDLVSLGQADALTLRGPGAQATTHFGVPGTKVVDQATLTVRYRASFDTLGAGSSLELALNGTAISSLPIQGSQADSSGLLTVQVPLPSDLFVHDNALTFQLHAQCSSPCAAGGKSEPWVRIESTSVVETSGLVLALPNRLSILPGPFFDASIQRSTELPIAFGAQPDAQVLEAAGIVASWYGTLADFRGTHFPVSIGEIPHGNVVLLAASGSSLLTNLGLTNSGPGIAIRDNPSDPYGKLLVLTGETGDQIVTAARALALGHYPREVSEAQLANEEMPGPRAAYDSPRWLPAGQSVRIGEAAPAALLRAGNGNPAKLYFRLAPDLYFGSHANVPLRMAYRVSGVADGTKGEIQINLNGVFVGSREVQVHTSTESEWQSFAIPSALLYPSNTLTVNFVPLAQAGTSLVENSPELSVSRTTELDLSGISHYARMPRMDLFASAGFPFTRFADLSATAVVLPDNPSTGQIGIYLDALGFFGAQTGYPGLRVRVMNAVQASHNTGKDLLIIGSGADQPLFAQRANLLPVQIADGRFVMNQAINSWFDPINQIFQHANEKNKLSDLLNGEIRPSFVLEQFSDGTPNGATSVVIAESSSQNTDPLLSMLASASRQGHISGSVVILADGHFHSSQYGLRPFYVGAANWVAAFNCWMSFHVWIIPVLVILCSFLLARRWDVFLERRAMERLEVGS